MTEGKSAAVGASLVLGGSGGIGAACAKRLAEDHAAVAISYNSNQDSAERVLKGVEQGSCHQLNIADAEQCAAVIEAVIKQHGRISSLVYAIGTNIEQPLVSEITPQQWSEVLNNDLAGFMHVVQPVITHMRENGGGSLVHISSAGLGKTPPRDSLSIAPKAAIDALMKTIAMEEGRHNIRANSVGVGVIEAGIFKRLEAQGVFDDDWKTTVKAALPLGCFGDAEDIAEAVAFFTSSRSKYITGQTLFVDGGYSA